MSADPWARLLALEGVPAAFAAARDGIDALLRDRGLRRREPSVTVESLLRGAVASAALEGSRSSLDDVRAGRVDRLAAATLRVSGELLSLAPVLQHSPLQALARIHALAEVSADAHRRGRPRDASAARSLQALSRALLAETSAPALLVAAATHGELAAGAPFASLNGVVARAAERLVLVSRGIDPTSVTVPEAGHLARFEDYVRALAGYRRGDPAGAQVWLLHCAGAYAMGAEASPLSPTGREPARPDRKVKP